MVAFVQLFDAIVGIIIWIILINVILGWLVFFDVINIRNQFVSLLYSTTSQILEPMLRPFRELQYRIMPTVMNIDLSPIALILTLIFIQNLMYEYLI